MPEITEKDIDNMIEADREAKEEFERMTPQERLISALRAEIQALETRLRAVRHQLKQEENRKPI